MTEGTDTHAVLVGPIQANLTLADGTVVDAYPPVVYVDTYEQAQEVAHLVGQHYADNGHPTDPEFTYNKAASAPRKKA